MISQIFMEVGIHLLILAGSIFCTLTGNGDIISNALIAMCSIICVRIFFVAKKQAQKGQLTNGASYATGCGVLFTFIGVAIGLYNFSTNSGVMLDNIDKFLGGMKLAFVTSIIGLIISFAIRYVQAKVIEQKEQDDADSLLNLNEYITKRSSQQYKESQILEEIKEATERQIATSVTQSTNISSNLYNLAASIDNIDMTKTNEALLEIVGEIKNSSSTQVLLKLDALTNSLNDFSQSVKEQNLSMQQFSQSVQKQENAIQDLRTELIEENKNQTATLSTMGEHISKMEQEFVQMTGIMRENQKSSSELLAKTLEFHEKQNQFSKSQIEQMAANTEVIHSLKSSFDTFLSDMSEKFSDNFIMALRSCIENLNENLKEQFGENFKRLDNAVGQMNEWQKKNKEAMQQLNDGFLACYQAFCSTEETLSKMENPIDKLNKTIQDFVVQITESQEIQRNIHTEVLEMQKSAEKTVIGIKTSFDRLTSDMNKTVEETLEVFTDSCIEVNKNMEAGLEKTCATMLNCTYKSTAAIDTKIEVLTNSINDTLKKSLHELTDASVSINKDVKQAQVALNNALKDNMKDTIAMHEAYMGQLEKEYRTSINGTKELQSEMKNTLTSFKDSMEDASVSGRTNLLDLRNSMDMLVQTVQKNTKDLSEAVEGFGIRWEESITEAMEKIGKAYTALASQTGQSQKEALEELGTALSTITQRMTKDYSTLADRIEALDQALKGSR